MRRKKEPVRQYSLAQDNNHFYIVHAGEPVTTPMGYPLRTNFRELAQEMVEDIERQGPDPQAGVSMYTCLCSCLDFGEKLGKIEMIKAVLPALIEDPVLHMSADPEIMFTQMVAYRQPYFEENNIWDKKAVDLMRWAAKEMALWTMQEIMVVHLAWAHINSPLIGMALAQGKVNVEAGAIGFCGKYWQHKMEQLGGICIGAFPEFYPNRMDESFCETVCLVEPDDDEEEEPASESSENQFLQNCGVAISLDVWRRFAAYGRSQRI